MIFFKTFSKGDIGIDFIISFKLVLFPKFNPLSQKKMSYLSYAISFQLIFFMKKNYERNPDYGSLKLKGTAGLHDHWPMKELRNG